MSGKASNKKQNEAKKNKNDDFYTQLDDINNELKHYKDHFRGKVVYCNCDDPRVSMFFEYFSLNFEHLGLKRLITTCYKSQERDLFSTKESERAIRLEYNGIRDGDMVPKPEDIGIHQLKGDGDFRSRESIELLKQADIVVTNPPFSLFREYVAQLVEHGKKFLTIGNIAAASYKEIFPLLKENKIWIGVNSPRWFYKPNGELYETARCYWYTNLDVRKRNQELILVERYTPEKYPEYDNYHAINVEKTKEIPRDYDGVMGVPITFLNKYNPDKFEILGSDYEVKERLLKLAKKEWDGKTDRGYMDNKRFPPRIFIRNKNPEKARL